MKNRRKLHLWKNGIFLLSHIGKCDARYFVLCLVWIPVLVITRLQGSYFSKHLVAALEVRDFSAVVLTVVFFCLLRHLAEVSEKIAEYRMKIKNHRLKSYFVELYAAKYMSLDYESVEKPDIKDAAQRTLNQIFSTNYWNSQSVEEYPKLLTRICANVVEFGTCVGLIVVLEPLILLMLLFNTAVTFFSQKYLAQRVHEDKKKTVPVERKINYIQSQARDFFAVKDIRLYRISRWLKDIFAEQYGKWREVFSARSRRTALLTILVQAVDAVFRFAVYAVLFMSFYRGEITVSDFVFYLGIVTTFSALSLALVGNVEKVIAATYDIEDIRRFLMLAGRMEGTGTTEIGDHSVEFSDVCFSYGKESLNTINHLSFRICSGEKIGIVGLNGAGKTTLVKLMCGLYHPQSGEVRIGGKRTRDLSRDALAAHIAPVFQEVHLLPASLAKNIALVPNPEKERLTSAIVRAGLEKRIESLPSGVDTRLVKSILPDALELSGGDMQKLALARALYKSGGILILDEPTAALDPIAESAIYQSYCELTQGKTAIFISHRLASTGFCDRIFFMEKGRIAECGTHEELMRMGGKYAKMFELQARYYNEENKIL